MEYCTNWSLDKVLEKNVLSLSVKLKISQQLAEAINWLHSKDPPVIHKHLHPSKILVLINTTTHVRLTKIMM